MAQEARLKNGMKNSYLAITNSSREWRRRLLCAAADDLFAVVADGGDDVDDVVVVVLLLLMGSGCHIEIYCFSCHYKPNSEQLLSSFHNNTLSTGPQSIPPQLLHHNALREAY